MSRFSRIAHMVEARIAGLRAIRTLKREDPVGVELAQQVRGRRLTFLEVEALMDLRRRAQQLDRADVPGVYLEAGCALGGSAIMLAGSKAVERPLEVYDVFGLIPPPSDRDGVDVHRRYDVIAAGRAKGFRGDTYYGYQPDIKARVEQSFREAGYPVEEHHVTLVEGLFEETIHPAGQVALAHVDGDWYESVKVCLDRIWPALSPGGVIVVDDYQAWSGCRTAVDEFLASATNVAVEQHARLHLVKTG